MKKPCQITVVMILIFLSACNNKALDSKRIDLNPYLKAISDAGELRDSLGFSLMIDTSDVSIERGNQFCDVLMQVTQRNTVQTIAFKNNNTGLEWIGEEEKFLGPRYMTTSRGDIKEAVVLSYAKTLVFHHAPGRLHVEYQTPDSTRDMSSPIATASGDLPENEARAMIKEWTKAQ